MRSRRRLGLAVLAGLSMIGVIVAPASATTVSAGASSWALREYYAQRPVWTPCDFDGKFQCATIETPLDYAKPRGERVKIAISRLKATDSRKRRGVLLALNGGPGGLYGMGRATPTRLTGTALPQAYDLIGFDPRGVGASTPLYCAVVPPTAGFDSRPPDSAFAAITADARASMAGCERTAGNLLPYFTTAAAARDMDVIRGVLGERKLNYLGYADASYIGAAYGSLFPWALDRNVLDSSRNPDVDWRGQHMSQAYAIKDNVEAWAKWAGERNFQFGLGRSTREVLASVEQVAAKLASAPIGRLDRTAFDGAVGEGTIQRPGWADFGRLISDLRKPTTAPATVEAVLKLAQASAPWPPSGEMRWGLIEATTCEDNWPRNENTYYRDMRKFRAEYPYGLGFVRAQVWACSYRTYTPPERTPYLHRFGYPKGIVVHGTGNTVLRHAGGEAMADRLRHSLVTVVDEGNNEVYALRGNTCVDNYVTRYFLTGAQPPNRATCAGPARPAIPADRH